MHRWSSLADNFWDKFGISDENRYDRDMSVFQNKPVSGFLLNLGCFLILLSCQEFGKDSDVAGKNDLREATARYSLFFRGTVPSAKANIKKGKVGSLLVDIKAADNGNLVVTGRVSSAVGLGIGGFTNKTYRLNEEYRPVGKPRAYNILTLPLRLQHLAQERKELLTKADSLLQTIAIQRRSLITLGTMAYRGFPKLPAIKKDKRTLTGLKKRLEIKFAGKSLVSHLSKARQEIESMAGDLRNHVSYQAESIRPLGKNTVIPSSEEIFQRAATIYLRKHPEVKRRPLPFTPKFKSKSSRTADKYIKAFQQLVSEVSTLRQAELLLIRTVYRLYEPIYLSYSFDLMGVKDRLNLSVTTEDKRRTVGKKLSVVRHKIKATSQKHGKFLFGYVDYDNEGRVIRLSHNLGPVGRGRLEMVLVDLREVRS